MLSVAMLAGGLATRLRPITETIPKALVEVAGTPFICRQLTYLAAQGIGTVVLCIGHLGAMIETEVGDGSRFGLKIVYSPDGAKPLGTGGALKKALPLLGDAFFVLYGDSFLPIDYMLVQQAFLASGKDALMTVLRNGDKWDKSNVLFRDGALLEYNKKAPKPDMMYIDYGLGVLSASALDEWGLGAQFDLAEVYHRLSLQGRVAGYEVHERFYEIGSFDGLRETELYFTGKGKT